MFLLPIYPDSSDDELFSESLSKSSDDEPDEDSGVDNYLDIPEFDFSILVFDIMYTRRFY